MCFQCHRVCDLLAQEDQLALAPEHKQRETGDGEQSEQSERASSSDVVELAAVLGAGEA